MRRRARGAVDTDTLLKVILVLVIVWIGIEIANEFVDTIRDLIGPFDSILGLVIVVLIILYLLDRL